MPPSLSQAHGRQVTVELALQGREVILSGRARYEKRCLLVDIQDAAGDFTLCLDESKWDGEITHSPDDDTYTIRLLSPA
jgi:hypothetical protein